MDASRLLEVLTDLDSELEGGLATSIANLVRQYTVASNPAIDNSAAIQEALSSLIEFIDEGQFSEYPPLVRQRSCTP